MVVVAGSSFQTLLAEQCVQADVAYVPPVTVSTRSRFGLPSADDRKTAKSGRKDDKAKSAADDRTGPLH